MKTRIKNTSAIITALWLGVGQSPQSLAQDVRLEMDGTVGRYADSPEREQISDLGATLQWSYYERFQLYGGGRFTQLDYVAAAPALEQTQWHTGFSLNQYLDSLGGQLSWNPSWIHIDDSQSDSAGQVDAGSFAISFTPYQQRWSNRFGYSQSSYAAFDVQQWEDTFTLFSHAQQDSWSLKLLTTQASDNDQLRWAGDLSWYHGFAPPLGLHPAGLFITLQAGERQYSVEPLIHTVYNLGDIMHEAVRAGLRWQLTGQQQIGLSAGASRYEHAPSGVDYTLYQLTLDLGFGL